MLQYVGPCPENVATLHEGIEKMTRLLELEKRRVHRLGQELAIARSARDARIQACCRSREGPVEGGVNASAPRAPMTPKGGKARPQSLAATPIACSAANRSSGSDKSSAIEPPLGLPVCADASVASNRTGSKGRSAAKPPVAQPATNGLKDRKPPLRTLFHRLEVQRARVDSIKHQNKELRKEIDAVRQQRLTHDQIFSRLKREVIERSQQLSSFAEEAAASQAIHSDALHRVAVITRHREEERAAFKRKVMSRRDDMEQQMWERKEKKVELQRIAHRMHKKCELVESEDEANFSETVMMRRILKTSLMNCIHRRHIKQHERTIEIIRQAFTTIQQATGIEHIEEIVRIFANVESDNFSILTHVNHMTQEKELLLARQRERFRNQEGEINKVSQQQHVRQSTLQDLHRQLNAADAAISEGQEKDRTYVEMIDTIRPSVMAIVTRLQQEKGLFQVTVAGPVTTEHAGLFGLQDPMTEDSLLAWLGVIERAFRRSRNTLQGSVDLNDTALPRTAAAMARLQPKSYQPGFLVKSQELPCSFGTACEDLGSTGGVKRTLSGNAAKMPATVDEFEEDDGFECRPLQLTELRKRTENALQRRSSRAIDGRDG